MTTIREDLLAAAGRLSARGVTEFSPAELIAEVEKVTSAHRRSSLGAHISGHMCVNTDTPTGGTYPDFFRIERGRYRLTKGAP